MKESAFMEFPIIPQKTALLVIDMNYVDAHRDYGMGIKMKELGLPTQYYFDRIDNLVIPNIQKLLGLFRENKIKVIYTILGNELPDMSDLSRTRRRIHAMLGFDKSMPGNREYEIREEIRPQPGELCIPKGSTTAWSSTGIDQLLKNMGIDTIILTGVATNACIYNNAISAMDRGYWVLVVNDATATFSEELQKFFTSDFVARVYFRVQNTDEVIAEIKEALKKKGL